MNKTIFTLASVLLCGLPLQATVTINMEGGVLRNSSGGVISDGGLIVLVASTNPNGDSAGFSSSFNGNASTSVGTFLTADDQIIASFSVSSVAANGLQGGYAYALNGLTYSGNLGFQDQLQLYWFPTLTSASTTFGVGTSYGEYRSDLVLNGSSIKWELPADGTPGVTLNFFTASGGGSVADSLGNATLTTVPEPATTVALLGGAAGLFVMYRRRQRKVVAPASAS